MGFLSFGRSFPFVKVRTALGSVKRLFNHSSRRLRALQHHTATLLGVHGSMKAHGKPPAKPHPAWWAQAAKAAEALKKSMAKHKTHTPIYLKPKPQLHPTKQIKIFGHTYTVPVGPKKHTVEKKTNWLDIMFPPSTKPVTPKDKVYQPPIKGPPVNTYAVKSGNGAAPAVDHTWMYAGAGVGALVLGLLVLK